MNGFSWPEALLLGMTLAATAILVLALYYERRGRSRYQRRDLDTYLVMEQALTSQQKRHEQQARRIDEMERQRMTDHALILELYKRIGALENYVSGLEHYVAVLVGQLEAAGIAPAAVPNTLRKPVAVLIDKRALRDQLAEQFDNDEMSTLMFDIGISDEELSGSTRQARARELVEYAERHGLLEILAEAVTRSRPGK